MRRHLPLLALVLACALHALPALAYPTQGRYEVRQDTILDRLSGLAWTRDAGMTEFLSYSDAKQWVAALRIGGHHDWRLPTERELLNLFTPFNDVDGTEKRMKELGFVNIRPNYWSSRLSRMDDDIMIVFSKRGSTGWVPPKQSLFEPTKTSVWAVRNEIDMNNKYNAFTRCMDTGITVLRALENGGFTLFDAFGLPQFSHETYKTNLDKLKVMASVFNGQEESSFANVLVTVHPKAYENCSTIMHDAHVLDPSDEGSKGRRYVASEIDVTRLSPTGYLKPMYGFGVITVRGVYTNIKPTPLKDVWKGSERIEFVCAGQKCYVESLQQGVDKGHITSSQPLSASLLAEIAPLERAKRLREYRAAYAEATSVKSLSDFLGKYDGYDPDSLRPKAKARLEHLQAQEAKAAREAALLAEKQAREARLRAEKQAREQAVRDAREARLARQSRPSSGSSSSSSSSSDSGPTQVDYIMVTADIQAWGNYDIALRIDNYNGSPDSQSPGRISDKSEWWHSKTIGKGYNGRIGGRYKFEVKFRNVRNVVCSGTFYPDAGKSSYRIQLHEDCTDAGSGAY